MELAAYLKAEKIKPSRFAARMGVPASTIIRIIRGERRARLSTAAKIVQASGGMVGFSDLVADEPPAPAPLGGLRA